MATVYGVVSTAVTAGGIGTTPIAQGFIDARVKTMIDQYTALGTETTGTIILMGAPLPAGAKVIRICIQPSTSTSSLTISVGDGYSATKYVSASTGPATGPSSNFYPGQLYVIGTHSSAAANDAQIQLTTGGATLAIGTIITCIVEYTFD